MQHDAGMLGGAEPFRCSLMPPQSAGVQAAPPPSCSPHTLSLPAMSALLAALAVPGPPQQLILGHLSLQER